MSYIQVNKYLKLILSVNFKLDFNTCPKYFWAQNKNTSKNQNNKQVKAKSLYVSCLLSKKKAQNNWSYNLMHNKPFGYRVTHLRNLLVSCSGHYVCQRSYKLDQYSFYKETKCSIVNSIYY